MADRARAIAHAKGIETAEDIKVRIEGTLVIIEGYVPGELGLGCQLTIEANLAATSSYPLSQAARAKLKAQT